MSHPAGAEATTNQVERNGKQHDVRNERHDVVRRECAERLAEIELVIEMARGEAREGHPHDGTARDEP